jgi:hypothetical protein
MSRANFPIPSRLAVSAGSRLPLISASAGPSWRELDHHLFAWEDDESTTGLTSTAGWMTISREGGP